MKQTKKEKKAIKISGKLVGEGNPCFIIAEAGANFRISDDQKTNYNHALKLIDIAAEAGADAVKFQLYRAEKMYTKDAGYADYLGKKKPIFDLIQEMELPYEWLPKLKKYCDGKKIIFLCTPFDEQAVDELENVGIEAYKIASYTVSHLPLLKYIAKTGKPIILSTGASDLREIKAAIKTIAETGNEKIILMQCTAKYPAPLSTINLKTIPLLKKRFRCPIGLSDHSREPLIAPLGAVSLGADVIEKHYTTDNSLPGPDHCFAILQNELIDLVLSIRKLEKAMGTGKKKVLDEEQELYNFARRFIYAKRNIKKGEIFSEENLIILRCGKSDKGLSPGMFEKILGKRSLADIEEGNPVKKRCVYGK
jgi:N,N'-diacetyllegionaminate synthase